MRLVLAASAALLASAVVLPSPAAAQAWFFPDYALPSAGPTPATWLGVTYGRGLNDSSGEADAFGATIGRTTERASLVAMIGTVNGDGTENESTLGAAVGVDLNTGDGPVVTLQGGLGWMSFDIFGESLTLWRFPIGLAIKGDVQREGSRVVPWIMPRLNIVRVSAVGESETEADLGASAGLSITSESGLGIHGVLDALFPGDDVDTVWTLGVGVHLVLGSND